MADSIEELFNLVEQHIDLEGEYSAIDRLKAIGLEHDEACGFVEIVILKKKNFFSRTARLKRFFGKGENDAKSIFGLLCRNLLSSRYYKSVDEIHKKIVESEKVYKKLEVEYGYRDDLYYYSTVVRRKIIVLVNLHFNDFSNSLQNEVINLMGQGRLLHSINSRSQHMYQKLEIYKEQAQEANDEIATNELEIIENLFHKHTHTSTIKPDEKKAFDELVTYLINIGKYQNKLVAEQDAKDRVSFFNELGLYKTDPQLANASQYRRKVHALIYAHNLHDVIVANNGDLPCI